MKLCTGCFWYSDERGGTCMEKHATIVSPVDGKRRQYKCDLQRGYPSVLDSCGPDARFWTDKDCDVCSVCQEPLDPTDSVGDDEQMHLNCAIGKAESASEGDR
jgi:hypothetical protein